MVEAWPRGAFCRKTGRRARRRLAENLFGQGLTANNSSGGCTMKRVNSTFAIAVLGDGVALAIGAETAAAQTLKAVKDRGSLICGVSQGIPGFSNPDDRGNWTGLYVDLGRAIA